jgi:hypothetical protein
MHELIRVETLQGGGAPLLNMPTEGRNAVGKLELQTVLQTPAKRDGKEKVSKIGVKKHNNLIHIKKF